MNESVKKLYPETIREHNAHPYHFEKRSHPSLKAYNPLCGDKFEMYIHESGDLIDSVYFHGFGCAISKASTSILAKTLEGKRRDDAIRICDDFLHFVNQETNQGDTVGNDVFSAFSSLHEFPERRDCATLSWREMKTFLESKLQGNR
jgi:nitrogen fixation NifU-like protein